MTPTDRPSEPAPFLEQDPPPLAARALAGILLLLFATAGIAAVVVQVPETVAAPFVLAPITGSDPVRALHEGTIVEVRVIDAQIVRAGETMFVVVSEPVGDRQAERAQLETQIDGAGPRLANERRRYDTQRLADQSELARLDGRLTRLRRQIALKEQQAALAREVATRQQRGYDEGILSWMDSSRPKLDADRLAVEVEQARADHAETESAVGALRYAMEVRRIELAELERTVREESDRARARKTMLDADTPHHGNRLTVTAPCSGTLVRLVVQAPGAVVHEGDSLAEIVCDGAVLQAELRIPQLGMALVRTGQPVRLFYDAFPYQRFGARYATLRWVSPASSGATDAAFRALADLQEPTVTVKGQARPVMVGMAGRASIVVGRRSLISYAFEPVRQLRENLADVPAE
jgi:membrane fusion protein